MTNLTRRSFVVGLSASAGLALPASIVARAPADFGELSSAISRLPRRRATLLLPNSVRRNPDHDAGIVFDGFSDLVVQGGPSTIQLSGRQPPFRFRNCRGIRISDVELDWGTAGTTEGRLVDISQDQKQIAVQIKPGFHVPSPGEIISIFGFVDERRGPARGFREIGGRQIEGSTVDAAGVVSLSLAEPFSPIANATLVMKLRASAGPAFIFDDCEDMVIDRVRIRRAPQMALVARRCSNIRFSAVHVGSSEISESMVSVGADGLHIINPRGNIEVDSCVFGGLGDDCLNVHEFYFSVERIDAEGWITIAPVTRFELQRVGAAELAPKRGDVIEIFERDNLRSFGKYSIVGTRVDGDSFRLQLSDALPAAAHRSALLSCRTAAGVHLSVHSSSFLRTRARGILVHSHARIANCTFENIGYAGVIAHADARLWGEGCGVEDVFVGDCVFDKCGLYRSGALEVSASKNDMSPLPGPATSTGERVMVARNTFKNCAGPIMRVSSIGAIGLENNTLTPVKGDSGPMIVLQNVEAAEMRANTFSGAGVASVDRESMKSIVAVDNKGLQFEVTK
jgi:hypothetical protein